MPRNLPTFSFRSSRCFLPLLFAVLLWIPARAAAQATGQVSGVISESSGRLVPSAAVELINTSTAQVRSGASNGEGAYEFPLVNPGMYQIRVTMSGFRTNVTDNVEVLVNGTTKIDVRLSVGGTNEQVTVTGAAPLVETGNATLGDVVDQQSIVDLPLNGRNFAQLGTLMPGVVAAPTGLGGTGPGKRDGGRVRGQHRQLQCERHAQPVQQLLAGWRFEQ